MSDEEIDRKITVIFATDVVGYSHPLSRMPNSTPHASQWHARRRTARAHALMLQAACLEKGRDGAGPM